MAYSYLLASMALDGGRVYDTRNPGKDYQSLLRIDEAKCGNNAGWRLHEEGEAENHFME